MIEKIRFQFIVSRSWCLLISKVRASFRNLSYNLLLMIIAITNVKMPMVSMSAMPTIIAV